MIAIIVGVLCTLLCFGLTVIIVLHKLFLKRQSKYLKNIAGPKPNPFFGNMLDFVVPSYETLNVIEKYADKYGSLFRIYNGPLSNAVVSLDEKFTEYILSSTQFTEKSDEYSYFHNWLGSGLLISNGSKWKSRRRMLTPAFHFSILENFIDVFDKVGNIFMQKLEGFEGKDSFNVYSLVSLYTLDVICEAAMGISLNAQNDGNSKYVQNVKKICAIITDRNFSPLNTRFYPLTLNYYKEILAVNVLHSHTDAVIDKKIAQLKYCDKKIEEIDDVGIKERMAFLDILLRSTIDGKPLSRKDIREEVDTFMFEGHDTTSSAISFTLYAFANHPLIQQKAFEEQIEILGNNRSEKLTTADLQNMKYLDLVIKETLRLYPPVPLFARKVPEEFEWDNMLFPKGQQIIILPYMCHRSPNFFPNPLEFIPERFSELDGSHPYRYIPFSAGPRNCIGQKFAMLEMKCTLSKILRNFHLLPAKDYQKLKLAPEIILVSKNGVNIRIRKRK